MFKSRITARKSARKSAQSARHHSPIRRSPGGWLTSLFLGRGGKRQRKEKTRNRVGDALRIEPLEERRVLATISFDPPAPSVVEGNSGETTVTFMLRLTGELPEGEYVTVDWETADDHAEWRQR
jgi:hypothetical protein